MLASIEEAILAASNLLGLGALRTATLDEALPDVRGPAPALRAGEAPQTAPAPAASLQDEVAEAVAAALRDAGYLKA